MSSKVVYHSALKGKGVGELDYGPVQYFEADRVIALQNDITRGLPEEFNKCDVLWGEPPWCHGFKVFNSRVEGKNDGSHATLMRKIDKVISEDNRPSFIVSGRAYSKYLQGADYRTRVLLPISITPVYLYSYRYKPLFASKLEVPTTKEVLWALSRKFECLGDWCCGYGYAGKQFYLAGKATVLADYNAKCIGAIKELYTQW